MKAIPAIARSGFIERRLLILAFVGACLGSAGAQTCGCPVHDSAIVDPIGAPVTMFGGYTFAALPSLSGGYDAFVGAPYDDTLAPDAGLVYQIHLATGAIVRTIASPSPSAGENFGMTLGVAGGNVIVGATGADTVGPNVGAAYLFDGGTGAHLLTFLPPAGTPAGAFFGFPVAASADLTSDGIPEIAVGAGSQGSGVLTGAGNVHVFDGATGAIIRTLADPVPAANELFGMFISAEGTQLLVGAAYHGPVFREGRAYLFDVSTGALLRTFNNPTPGSDDHFGEWVALSGNRAIVTAHLDNNIGGSRTGAAYVFDTQTGALLYTWRSPNPGFFNDFGYAVAVSGNQVLIGEEGNDVAGVDSGAAHLFDLSTGALKCSLRPPGSGFQRIGIPVGFAGPDILVGNSFASYYGLQTASVHVFKADTNDSDGDCLPDSNETALGTDPFDPDTDDDGLTDGEEVATHGTLPLDPDSDDDGLLDGTEVDMAHGSGCPNPLDFDSDDDGLADGTEVALGTNACNPDTDSDGVSDATDPLPLQPGVTCGFLEQMVRGTGLAVESFDLSLFTGNNGNASAGRRNSMASRLQSAANHVCAGQIQSSVAHLAAVYDLVDGLDSNDWMYESPEKAALRNAIAQIQGLIAILP